MEIRLLPVTVALCFSLITHFAGLGLGLSVQQGKNDGLVDERKVLTLVLVVDNKNYRHYGNNSEEHANDLVRIMNRLYAPLHIQIILSMVVVWNEVDLINITSNADETLNNFMLYRLEQIRTPNDHAQLLTATDFSGGVTGKAMEGTLCTSRFSATIVTDHFSMRPETVATSLAHELAHTFGVGHDDGVAGCECAEANGHCIMSASGSANKATHFSSCSIQAFKDAFSRGVDYCIWDAPIQYCRNGKAGCNPRDEQCRRLWGTSNGPSVCYGSNTEGTKEGHCGYSMTRDSFQPCEIADIMCGAVQCVMEQGQSLRFGYEPAATRGSNIVQDDGQPLFCRTVSVDFGARVVDPGLVADGSPCGEGKVCQNQKCIVPIVPCNCTGLCNCHCYHGECQEETTSGSDKDTSSSTDAPWPWIITAILAGITILIFIIVAVIRVWTHKHATTGAGTLPESVPMTSQRSTVA